MYTTVYNMVKVFTAINVKVWSFVHYFLFYFGSLVLPSCVLSLLPVFVFFPLLLIVICLTCDCLPTCV